jgi:glycosyltransferase involved in cell wall biosynthesis
MIRNKNNHKRAKKKLLFVGPPKKHFRPFMQQDLDLLKKKFDVRLVNVCFDLHYLKCTIAALFNLVAGVAWADVVFCWFAARPAFPAIALSQLYNKKTVVAVGGEDVTTIPELGYGLALHKREHFYQMFVLNKATRILPDSRDAEKGTLALVKDAAKVTLIYLGVDAVRFHPSGTKKEKVLTVGEVWRRNLYRKGFETFVKSARYLEDVEFVLVGQFMDDSINYLRSIASNNVRFTGRLPASELIRHYQEAKVYVQVSAHEAFGLSLTEAMACECVPVVTDRGAIPEVVGDTGVYVPYGDPAATARAIEQALTSETGGSARQRIEEMFTVDKREEALLKTMCDL